MHHYGDLQALYCDGCCGFTEDVSSFFCVIDLDTIYKENNKMILNNQIQCFVLLLFYILTSPLYRSAGTTQDLLLLYIGFILIFCNLNKSHINFSEMDSIIFRSNLAVCLCR